MPNRNLIILGVAILVAAFVVFLLNSYLTGVEERAEVQAQEQRLARIVGERQPVARNHAFGGRTPLGCQRQIIIPISDHLNTTPLREVF